MKKPKESLSPSKAGATGGGRRKPSTGTEPVKGNPTEFKKKPEPEIIRFNWNEVDEVKGLYCDPENSRRKIPQIVAKFPQGVTVTIYGSHFDKKSDRKITHLIHKNRNVSLEPYRTDEAQDSWKSYPPPTSHPAPSWASMIFFSGTWGVCRGENQSMNGEVFKDKIRRSAKGTWSSFDPDVARALGFVRKLTGLGVKKLRPYSFLHAGLWDGLLPALSKGKFKEIESVFKFARKIELKKESDVPFVLDEHFPATIFKFERLLIAASLKRERQHKIGPPSASELMGYVGPQGLCLGDSEFREGLKLVELGWLLESRRARKK